MADTVGLALGAISLGLEVCKGITKYADAVRGRTDDLNSLARQATTLAANLNALQVAITRLQQTRVISQQLGSLPATFQTVQDSIRACKTDLKTLQAFIDEFSGNTSISHPDFADKCREHFRKVKYGFKQSRKTEIEGLMTAINSTLLIGIGALELDSAADAAISLGAVEKRLAAKMDTNEQSVALLQTHAIRKLDGLETSAKDVGAAVHAEAATILGRVDDISDQLQTLMTMTRQGEVPPADLDVQHGTIGRPASTGGAQFTAAELVAVRRLLAKPSLLKETLDSVGSAPGAEKSQEAVEHVRRLDLSRSLYNCTCRQYSILHEQHTKIGRFGVSNGTVDSFKHLPGCGLFQSPAGHKTTQRVIRARVNLFSVMVEAAFVVASSWPSGAGGLSISPSLVATVMVNAKTAPAFRVFKVLDSFYWDNDLVAKRWNNEDDRMAQGMLDHALQKLRSLFQTRRAMPGDVDENGNTLMHSFAWLFLMLDGQPFGKVHEDLRRFGHELVAFHGVPLTQENFSGDSPFTDIPAPLLIEQDHKFSVLRSFLTPNSVSRVSMKFTQIPPFKQLFLPVVRESARLLPESTSTTLPVLSGIYCTDAITARPADHLLVFDLHPFDEAILNDDRGLVSAMIRQNPSMVKQKSIFHCPNRLGLALSAGLCVNEIIQCLKESTEGQAVMRDLLDNPCWLGKSVAEFVMAACRNNGRPHWRDDSDTCPWASSLRLVAREGCLFGTQHRIWTARIYGSCKHCAETYASALRDRRQDLKQLALKVLPSAISDRFGLRQTQLLDRHTAAVIQTLHNFGVEIPVRLSIAGPEDDHVPLYHSRVNWHLGILDALFAVGFQDIDVPDQHGLTPLQKRVGKTHHFFPVFAGWLLEHGADMARPYVPAPISLAMWRRERKALREYLLYPDVFEQLYTQHAVLGLKLVHMLAFFAPESSSWREEGANACTVKRILRCAHLKDKSDGCRCAPVGGWTPFSYFLVGMLSESKWALELADWKGRMAVLFRKFEDWFEPSHYRIAFQLMTFEVLSLDHSCVLSDGDIARDDDFGDTNESEEDQRRREVFERIVMETEQMIETDTGTTFQDSGCKAQGDDLAGGADLVIAEPPPWRDWLLIWGKNIEPEVAKLESLVMSAEDRAKAEELGVIWCDPPPAWTSGNANATSKASVGMDDSSLNVNSYEYRICALHQQLEEIV